MSASAHWAQAFFDRTPVFRTTQFIDAAPSSEHSARDLLKYYRRTGRLRSVRPGLWHTVATHGEHPDPVVVAGCVAPDAIVAMNAAMGAYGLGHSAFNVAIVYTSTRIRPFTVSGTLVRALPHPQALATTGTRQLETVELHRMGSRIRVTTRERALVDMLDRQELCGGIEEVWRTARQLGWIEDRALLPYLAARSSTTLWARTGYLLEHEPQIAVSADAIERIHQAVVNGGRGPWQFAPHVDGPQDWDSRWRVMVPRAALPDHWEEPAA